MPHFGLMSTKDSFETEAGALLRSRLHIRSGKSRLRQGKISAGLVTLFDAFMFGLRWYVSSPERRKLISENESLDRKDEKMIFEALRSSQVLKTNFDFESFNALIEKALDEEIPDYDYSPMVKEFDELMTQLGVMPFDEAELPAEKDPAGF